MEAAKLLEMEAITWQDSLVLVAFPTTGSAASIAGHYLRQHLSLPLVGSLYVENQLPIVAVHNGIASSPIRIFGGEVACELPEGKCPRVYLVTTDLVLDPVLLRRMAAAVLEHASTARLILCLDAVVRDADDDTPDVYTVASGPHVLKQLQMKGASVLEEALIAGMTGELLLKARPAGVPVGSLVVEASQGVPDGRAAAALLQAVGELVPAIPMETEPLVKEAMELEKRISEAQRKAEKTQQTPARQIGTFI